MPVKKKKKLLRKASAKSVKALASKTAKASAKLKKTDSKIKSDLVKLKAELAKLKKNPKAKKRELNEYNLFMRKQLRLGKTFKQAVAAWKRFKKLLSKRKPSAYNSFIASQLKQGRSFPQAVAFWKAQKKGAKLKQKVKIRRVVVKAKPKLKYRTRIKRVLVKSKPKIKYRIRTRIIEKPVEPAEKTEVISLPVQIEDIVEKVSKKLKYPEHGLPVEEIAYRMLTLYFEELARLGLKRNVSLNELVDIYQYSLNKISQKLGNSEKSLLHEEEIAHRIVKLYFLELARFGRKRTTSLDELIDAYFLVLSKIGPAPKTA
ncbi:MAG: hypothetical protein PHD95_02185 [Candidatus ainarchaeum sp.]|nr:hypothetical protein [Candidatus ainarchaeum sp.]